MSSSIVNTHIQRFNDEGITIVQNGDSQVIYSNSTPRGTSGNVVNYSTVGAAEEVQPTKRRKKSAEHVRTADGYDITGYDDTGFDRSGYDRYGYDRYGYNRQGFNRSGYNRDGKDEHGYDFDGYDKYGMNKEGYDRDGYDDHGFNRMNVNKQGYHKDGHRAGTRTQEYIDFLREADLRGNGNGQLTEKEALSKINEYKKQVGLLRDISELFSIIIPGAESLFSDMIEALEDKISVGERLVDNFKTFSRGATDALFKDNPDTVSEKDINIISRRDGKKDDISDFDLAIEKPLMEPTIMESTMAETEDTQA